MKTFLFVFIFLVNITAFADVVNWPEDANYHENTEAIFNKIKTKTYDEVFSKDKFTKIEFLGEAMPLLAVDWIDDAFISNQGHALVLIKKGINFSEQIKPNTLYKSGEHEYILHVSGAEEGVYDAIYFSGFIEVDIVKFINSNRLEHTKIIENNFRDLGESRSVADENNQICKTGNQAVDSKSAATLRQVGSGFSTKAMGCLKGVLSGAWNATGGAVVSLFSGVRTVLTQNPLKTFRDAKSAIKNMATFVSNFSSEMQKIFSSFNELPDDLKVQIICETAASVGAGVLVSLLTGGTSFQLALIRPIFSIVEKLKLRWPNNKALTRMHNQILHKQVPKAVFKEKKPVLSLSYLKLKSLRKAAAQYRYASTRVKIYNYLDKIKKPYYNDKWQATVHKVVRNEKGHAVLQTKKLKLNELYEHYKLHPEQIPAEYGQLKRLYEIEKKSWKRLDKESKETFQKTEVGASVVSEYDILNKYKSLQKKFKKEFSNLKDDLKFSHGAATAYAGAVACASSKSIVSYENWLNQELEKILGNVGDLLRPTPKSSATAN